MKKYKGYQAKFLGKELLVPLPKLNKELAKTVAPVNETTDNILRYPNYSVVQSASRKFPIYSAANINGKLFKSITRKEVKGSWKKDRRISLDHQWGKELYAAPMSDFDKGHLTKREDVQWSRITERAKLAAKETFYYTNAAPQHKNLNQALWRRIEDYILHKETIDEGLKVSVFTGPVLKANDPFFVNEVRNQSVQIPALYWKVVYYIKKGKLHQVGFLAGQEGILRRKKIVKAPSTSRGQTEDNFMGFGEADTYQVKVKLLEAITGLKFPKAKELLVDQRPQKLILEEVTLRGSEKQTFINGLVL